MAGIYLTIDDLNKLFQELTLRMLGLWVESPAPLDDDPIYSKVRISWPTGGAPSWGISDDIIFLQVIEEDDDYNRQRDMQVDTSYDDMAHIETAYTRIMSVNFTCYGPTSFDNAQTIRDGLYQQSNHDILAASNIYMIPDFAAPQRAPELYNNQWWERVDLKIKFNELIVRDATVNYIESAEMTVDNGEGSSETVVIQQT